MGILSQAKLFWLGTVSVLGVATLASVLFRDVSRSVIATAVALYGLFSLPDLLIGIAWWLSPPSQEEIDRWCRTVRLLRGFWDHQLLVHPGSLRGLR